MTHKKEYLSDNGTIVRETVEEIDILDGLRELAQDKIKLMKDKVALEERIKKMKEEHANKAKDITDRYNAIVKQLKPAVADAIKSDHIELNNLLAEAFPSDFDKVVPTIKADKGKRADGKPIEG